MGVEKPAFNPLVKDIVTENLSNQIIAIVEKLLEAKATKRFILVKFHHDADGITAALALLSFLPAKTIQQNSAIYNTREALKDLQLLQYEQKPIVVFVDLGSGKENHAGLQLLKAAGVECIIIDHHPLDPSIKPMASILNPWQIECENPSRYTAGYLACEIARAAGSKNIGPLALISCAADKSDLLPTIRQHKNQALVLDYLAMNYSYNGDLLFYKKVLGNDELFQSLLFLAEQKITNLAEEAKKQMKVKKFGSVSLCLIELTDILKHHDFYSRGKIATSIIEAMPDNEPHIVLGYGDKSIVLRSNDAALQKGIKLNSLIEKLKLSMGNFIESGGGHNKAAAIRVREGFLKEVVNAFVALVEN